MTSTGILLFFFFPSFVSAQLVDTFLIEKKWPVQAVNMYVDAFGQIYILDKGNSLSRLDSKSRVRQEFRDQRLGSLGLVDLSDPLDILLFYPEFQELVILDRTLTESGRLNLPSIGYFGIEAVGYSSDQNIWLYDPMQGTVKKVNFQGEILVESQIIPPLVGSQIDPIRIREQDQRVYVHCAEAGILVFDIFGKYLEKIPWDAGRSLQIGKELYFGCLGNHCKLLDPFSRKSWDLELPKHSASQPEIKALKVWYQTGSLYVLYPAEIIAYKMVSNP
ncbi:MAG: hypothetical protein GYB31_02490 [Bacteroidetes bacterium]|nr:hypothetical protein [Bacteroidota bacterium]